MPRLPERQSTDDPTRLVSQAEAARIVGVRRQNLGRWVPYLEAEEHGRRLFFTRASCERARDIRLARLASRAPTTAVA
jgi:hypothetical protein